MFGSPDRSHASPHFFRHCQTVSINYEGVQIDAFRTGRMDGQVLWLLWQHTELKVGRYGVVSHTVEPQFELWQYRLRKAKGTPWGLTVLYLAGNLNQTPYYSSLSVMFLMLKCTKSDFGWDSAPVQSYCLGLQLCPDAIAGFKGVYFCLWTHR